MLRTVIFAVAAIVLALLIYAATKPDSFHVERSISIKATPEKIFAFINDFHQWEHWTPYNKDPTMRKTFSGNFSGRGAAYAWEGNNEVGKGEISITESTAPSRIALELHMIEPMEGRNHVVFALKPEGDSTTVSWIMEGRQTYLMKVMGVFLNMDKMIGGDFEVGLSRLKALAEK